MVLQLLLLQQENEKNLVLYLSRNKVTIVISKVTVHGEIQTVTSTVTYSDVNIRGL